MNTEQKRVVINIFTDGSSHVDSKGFTGNSCTLATRELELALAGDSPDNRDERKKPDFFATNPQTHGIHN